MAMHAGENAMQISQYLLNFTKSFGVKGCNATHSYSNAYLLVLGSAFSFYGLAFGFESHNDLMELGVN